MSIIKGKPNLRFADFKEDWELRKLGEVGTLVSGLTYNPNDIDPKGVLVLRSSNVQKGILLFDDNVYVNSDNFNPVFVDDILICVRNGSKNLIGKNALITKEAEGVAFGAFMSVFRSDMSQFVFQLFSTSNYYKIIHQNLGATINSINGSDLKKFKFFFPKEKNEQLKIASFFRSIDNRIQVLEKKKSLLEQYKKGVMQKIFRQELRFKDEDGNEFPEWSKKKLGDLTYKVGKKNKENIQYPIYSINNQEGFLPQSEQFKGLDSNDRGYDISLYKIVYKETFAYNPARINVGSIGYSYDLNEVIVSSLYVCFKTHKELENLYLLAYLDTDRFNKDILRYEEGGVRQYLFYDNFSQIKIPLPSNAEQIKIANFLLAIDKNIEIVNKNIEHTKSYKKGLLQQMFV
jgi:type I restriction enzyme S subunit